MRKIDVSYLACALLVANACARQDTAIAPLDRPTLADAATLLRPKLVDRHQARELHRRAGALMPEAGLACASPTTSDRAEVRRALERTLDLRALPKASLSVRKKRDELVAFAVRTGSLLVIRAVKVNGFWYDAGGHALEGDFLASPLGPETRLSSAFGVRLHPLSNQWAMHRGVDYAAGAGTPVRAVSGGVVTRSSYDSARGWHLHIKHASGFESRYLHLQERGTKRDRLVDQGDVVGRVGASGRTTGPHLHFELRRHGYARSPKVPLPRGTLASRSVRARIAALARSLDPDCAPNWRGAD